MEAYRFIVRPNGNRLEIVLPNELVNRDVEVIILPAEDLKSQAAEPFKTAEPIRKVHETAAVTQFSRRPVSKEEALNYLIGCLKN